VKVLCISASNDFKDGVKETSSFIICRRVIDKIRNGMPQADCSILELKKYMPKPCTNCQKCIDSSRCVAGDDDFNKIYEQILGCDVLFIVSPHYAPIPAKLCMIMEKMESITFNPWLRDNSYKSDIVGIPTGVISHGAAGADWALREYEKVVNYPIANFLFTIPSSHVESRQLKLVPHNDDWKAGISVPPVKNYKDWSDLQIVMFEDYINKVISA